MCADNSINTNNKKGRRKQIYVTCPVSPVICPLSLTPKVTDPPPTTSTTMHSRMVHQDQTRKEKRKKKKKNLIQKIKPKNGVLSNTLFDQMSPPFLVPGANGGGNKSTHPWTLQLID